MKHLAIPRSLIVALALGAGLSGCNLYRLEVQQGNVLEQKQLAQLKPGMDREQVEDLLGTPLIQDPFHPQRWDYVYTFKPAYGLRHQRHVTLYFNADNKLARVGGDVVPNPASK